MRYAIIFLVLLLGLSIWVFFSKESEHERELKVLIEKHRTSMDSSRSVSEQWRIKAAEYFQAYSTAQTNAMKSEQRYNYLREQNEILRKRPVIRYNEPQLDSIFSGR